MAKAEFSLRERDRKRLIKDRLVRLAVSTGGVGVLAALVLIFLYLAAMVLPLFSDANLTPNIAVKKINSPDPIALGVDDHGQHAYLVSQQGTIDFLVLNEPTSKPVRRDEIGSGFTLFAKSIASQGWLAFATQDGEVKLFRPKLASTFNGQQRVFAPSVERFKTNLSLQSNSSLVDFSFSVGEQLTLAGYYQDGKVKVVWQDSVGKQQSYEFNQPFKQLDQIILTPDGATLYLRSGSELVVAKKIQQSFVVREVVDLSLGQEAHVVTDINLLSGAYSLLVSYQDGLVSQWFDVLADGQRSLTHIRDFQLASELEFLLPDTYRKGFYSFYTNGTVQNHYTTSEKLVMFNRAFDKAPTLAAMSNNEKYLLALSSSTVASSTLMLASVDNPYPEISLSSLWQKVWYESYPEPDYVWQTTSANNEFEAKFSVVPIAFGTLKAAAFAMLFAVRWLC